jgi:hypothetical protein
MPRANHDLRANRAVPAQASSRPPEVRLPHSRELSRHYPRRTSMSNQSNHSVIAVTSIGFRI